MKKSFMGNAKFLVPILLSGWHLQSSLTARAASRTSAPTPARASITQLMEPAVRQVPCSIRKFPYFFRVFVRGLDDIMPRSAVRKAHVWPQVQVRRYQSPDRLLATVPQQNYDGFRIGLVDNLWIYLDPKISSYSESSPRLAIEFKTLNPQKIRVEYRQAEYVPATNTRGNQERLVRTFGEPGAYIFEHSKGCWHLTQELRSAKTSP